MQIFKIEQQIDNLRLYRYIEGRDCLITDNELEMQGKRAGYIDALPLPPES